MEIYFIKVKLVESSYLAVNDQSYESDGATCLSFLLRDVFFTSNLIRPGFYDFFGEYIDDTLIVWQISLILGIFMNKLNISHDYRAQFIVVTFTLKRFPRYKSHWKRLESEPTWIVYPLVNNLLRERRPIERAQIER